VTGDPAAAADGQKFADAGRGITLCYERIGSPDAPPLVLVCGLGQQLHSWPRPFCEELADRGFCVIRFDNRDSGRSTHIARKPPGLAAMLTRRMGSGQYHLGDMARDATGLLDHLGYRDAHVAGASMGGMIAQTAAAHFPSRVRSLASLMSMTGAARIGRPAAKTWLMMLSPPPRSREAAVAASVRIFRQIGSHGFPFDESWVAAVAGEGWDRDPTSDGLRRQLAAIFHSGDRTAELRGIDVPTVVIHGDRDPMVHPSGGAATAAAIRNARLETIPGLGHDLPAGAWTTIIDLIAANALRAGPEPATQAGTEAAAPTGPVTTEPAATTEPATTEPSSRAGDTTRSSDAQIRA
jgi:pimeloyl-ACP methyl ester carboxylesterase